MKASRLKGIYIYIGTSIGKSFSIINKNFEDLNKTTALRRLKTTAWVVKMHTLIFISGSDFFKILQKSVHG